MTTTTAAPRRLPVYDADPSILVSQSLLLALALARPPLTHLSPTCLTSSRHPSPTRRSCASRRRPNDVMRAANANVESEMSGKAKGCDSRCEVKFCARECGASRGAVVSPGGT